jgi:hypothetical protein
MSVRRAFGLVVFGLALANQPLPGLAQSERPDAVPEDLGRFRVARLQYAGGGDWYANPSSLPNLLEELEARTGIRTHSDDVPVTLDDERLYSYPMLYATGHGTIRPTNADLERLRRYLKAGGFLWVDDNYGLDDSFRAMAGQLFPDWPLQPVSSSHPIYRSFYDLPGLPKIHEHDGDRAQGFAIFDERGRMAVFYSWSSDIGDGLEDPAVHGDAPQIREAAMQMAVNVCVFALTQP